CSSSFSASALSGSVGSSEGPVHDETARAVAKVTTARSGRGRFVAARELVIGFYLSRSWSVTEPPRSRRLCIHSFTQRDVVAALFEAGDDLRVGEVEGAVPVEEGVEVVHGLLELLGCVVGLDRAHVLQAPDGDLCRVLALRVVDLHVVGGLDRGHRAECALVALGHAVLELLVTVRKVDGLSLVQTIGFFGGGLLQPDPLHALQISGIGFFIIFLTDLPVLQGTLEDLTLEVVLRGLEEFFEGGDECWVGRRISLTLIGTAPDEAQGNHCGEKEQTKHGFALHYPLLGWMYDCAVDRFGVRRGGTERIAVARSRLLGGGHCRGRCSGPGRTDCVMPGSCSPGCL